MSTLDRIRRIVKAAILDLIEKADDPELALSRFIDEIELAKGEVRAEVREAEFQRDRLFGQIADLRQTLGDWMTKAEVAASKNEDELAKKALLSHRQILQEQENCEERLAEAELLLATLHNDLAELDKKSKEASLEQKRLSAQLRRADAEKRAAEALMRSDREAHAFEAVKEKVLDTQTASDAMHDVREWSSEKKFGALDNQFSLERELAALKERLRKQTSEKPT